MIFQTKKLYLPFNLICSAVGFESVRPVYEDKWKLATCLLFWVRAYFELKFKCSLLVGS